MCKAVETKGGRGIGKARDTYNGCAMVDEVRKANDHSAVHRKVTRDDGRVPECTTEECHVWDKDKKGKGRARDTVVNALQGNVQGCGLA